MGKHTKDESGKSHKNSRDKLQKRDKKQKHKKSKSKIKARHKSAKRNRADLEYEASPQRRPRVSLSLRCVLLHLTVQPGSDAEWPSW